MQGKRSLLAVLEQPGAEGVSFLCAVGTRPAQHQQVLGARARHIGKPFGFCDLSLLILLGCKTTLPPVGIEMEIQVGIVVASWRPPTSQLAPISFDRFLAFPEIRAEHHGIFESFAAMHRYDGDRRFRSITTAEVSVWNLCVVLQALPA